MALSGTAQGPCAQHGVIRTYWPSSGSVPTSPTSRPGSCSAGARAAGSPDELPDTLLLLEHPPSTRRASAPSPHERPVDGTPVVDVDRGGKITWHGPGQLVGYPIVKLPDHVDVVAYVRRLEEALIRVVRRPRRRRPAGSRAAAGCGSPATASAGPTARSRAIGDPGRQGVTMHGFALNCDPRPDRGSTGSCPCGISDAGVTSLAEPPSSGREVTRRRGTCRAARGRTHDGARLPGPPDDRGRQPLLTTRLPSPHGDRTRPGPGEAWRRGAVTDRPGRPQAAAPRGPQRRDPHRAQARRGSRPGPTMGPEYTELQALVKREGLHTVCQEAGCPNIFECWEDREATFLIGGDQCTRRCDFCQIDTGKPAAARPRRAAPGRRVGAGRWACATPPSPASPATTCPTAAPGCTPRPSAQIHALQPGHRRRAADPRLQRQARPARARSSTPQPEVLRAQRRDRAADLQAHPARASATSARSTSSRQAREAGLVTKSNLILGMGETREEISRGAARPARGRLRPDHHHPVPAPVRRATTRSSAGSSRRSSWSCRTRPRRSASPASCPARWSAPPTAPAGSTSRPSRPARLPDGPGPCPWSPGERPGVRAGARRAGRVGAGILRHRLTGLAARWRLPRGLTVKV